LWIYDGTLERIHYAFYVKCRAGRAGSKSNCCHHRQSKREKRGKRGKQFVPAGYDAGKKVKGKKRHILVGTPGLLLRAIVQTADIQDRDGGVLVLSTLFGLYPFLKKLFADGGFQGPQFEHALAELLPGLHVEIVKRSDQGCRRSIDCLTMPAFTGSRIFQSG
jgi:Transposase DDE domain